MGYSNLSAVNSSTTLLTTGSTFTGEWEYCFNFPSIIVAVKTDQDGYFTIQYSPDGINQDSTLTRYYRTAKINAPHRFTNTRKYCRITFTNSSASDQTFLRLQTCFGDHTELNAPIDSTLSKNFDATVTRPTDFHDEIALNRRQGCSLWNKFGYNSDVDTGTEILASFGGTYTPLMSASTLRFVSSSTDDDDGGIGCNGLVLYGVDANYLPVTEVVTLNGTSNVDTVSTWLGVNRVSIFLAGTSLTNVGTITITAVTGGTTQAQIPAGEGTTQQMIFHVPVSEQCLASHLLLGASKLSGGGAPKVTFKFWVFSAVSNAKYEVLRYTMDTSIENHTQLSPPEPFVISEKSAIWVEATTDSSNTVVSGRMSLVLHEDVDY